MTSNMHFLITPESQSAIPDAMKIVGNCHTACIKSSKITRVAPFRYSVLSGQRMLPFSVLESRLSAAAGRLM
jgi:hypothetical protein